MTATLAPTLTQQQSHPLDFYGIDASFKRDEIALRDRVRAFVDREIVPYVNPYWEKAEFPQPLFDRLKSLGICGGSIRGYGAPGFSHLGAGLVTAELSRGDGSIGTAFLVTSSLAMGTINLVGSDEQKVRWLPALARMDTLGAFALTEPAHGSDASHLQTTARRVGDRYVLNGRKRWIGNACEADLTIVWARDADTNGVCGFVVERDTPGFIATPIERKIALRALINADIELRDCAVSAENRLAHTHTFKDTARCLRSSRYMVAWDAVGHAMAAYEIALRYCTERTQFGKPIAGFQLVQDKLMRMLMELNAAYMVAIQVSRLADRGALTEGQASLAKVTCCAKARQVVAWGRELMGGNGIVLDYHMARHFADMEALYTYEGTNEINTMVAAREVTGLAAFV